ncbi:hypothetical protein ACM66B_006917 [Microbotryomycetes sp. NB124-2]
MASQPPAYLGSEQEPGEQYDGDEAGGDGLYGVTHSVSEFDDLSDPNGEITLRMWRGKGAVAIHDRVIFGKDDTRPLFYVDIEQDNAWKNQAGVNFTLRSKSKDGPPLARVTRTSKRIEISLPRTNLYKCELTKSSLLSRSYEFAGPPPDNAHFKWKISRLRANYILKRKTGSTAETCAAFIVPDLPGQRDGNFVLAKKYAADLPLFLATGVTVCLIRQAKEGLSNSPGVGYIGAGVGGGGVG